MYESAFLISINFNPEGQKPSPLSYLLITQQLHDQYKKEQMDIFKLNCSIVRLSKYLVAPIVVSPSELSPLLRWWPPFSQNPFSQNPFSGFTEKGKAPLQFCRIMQPMFPIFTISES